MKKVYWRPPRISRSAVALTAIVAVVVLAAVESLPLKTQQPWFEEKTRAAELARQAFDVIKGAKAERGVHPDPVTDPASTGMIGVALSPVTSNTGYLSAKQASVNPNFAAVVVHWLRQADVREGDVVAIGASGSFPALNVAAFAAVQTLRLEPIVVASTSASQFGANDVELLWVDMERVLVERGVFKFRSVAASPGGIDDRGFGISAEGRRLLELAVQRNGLEVVAPESLQAAIDERMRIYAREARGRPVKAYINIGGGSASVGTHVGKKLFPPGLNRYTPRGADQVDSVMLRFAQQGVAVIHITQIEELVDRFDLDATATEMPRIGASNVFVREGYNPWLAAGGIVVILGVMLALLRLDVGQRLLRMGRGDVQSKQPEQMV